MRVRDGYSGAAAVIGIDEPVFLVEIWKRGSTWRPSNEAWECAEHELEDCDVHEALRWAREQTPDDDHSRYVVYACYRATIESNADSDVHIRLTGDDPTRNG